MRHFRRGQVLLLFALTFPCITTCEQETEGFYIAVDTAAQMLVVDPMGHRKGVDPVTGSLYNEIPHAVFSDESAPSLDGSSNDETGDVHEFMTNPEFQPILGSYLIRLYGMKDDSIKLTITFISEIPSIVREVSIAKGHTIVYRLTYSAGAPPSFDSVGNSAVVKCGIGFGSPGTAAIRAKPLAGFGVSDTLRRAVLTLRWKTGIGFNLGAVTSTAYGFAKYGDTVNQGAYTYQKFRTIQPTSLNWQAGQEYTLFEVAVNDPVGIGRFELTNALSGGEWFVDINYLEKTDSVFYQPVALRKQ